MRPRLSLLTALVVALAAGAVAQVAPGADRVARDQPTGAPVVWAERVLATLPGDLRVDPEPWFGWVSVTPNLAGLAYRAALRSGQRRAAVVSAGQRGREFDEAFAPVLSPDGSRLAHLAAIPTADFRLGERPGTIVMGNVPRLFLVIGDTQLQVQLTNVAELGEDLVPVFSPDGRKVAFKAQRPGRTWAIGIIDLEETKGRIEEASIKWGPEFAAGADPPTWSPDSSHVVYAAAKTPTQWLVVTGTEPGEVYTDAITNHVVAFRSDGTAAFKAKDGGKWFIVVGCERQPSFDEVSAPFFRPDGTLVYAASQAGKHYLVAGAARTELAYPADGVVSNGTGSRVTTWLREEVPGKRGKLHLVINGLPGPPFDYAWRPSIDPETGGYAYVVRDGRKFRVVTAAGPGPAFDGVWWRPRIREDGAMAGYVALEKDKLWWKVVALR